MRQIVIAAAMALTMAGTYVTQAAIALTSREVTIRVERRFAEGGCQEDEVLRGRGDFENGMYARYGCWNPGW